MKTAMTRRGFGANLGAIIAASFGWVRRKPTEPGYEITYDISTETPDAEPLAVRVSLQLWKDGRWDEVNNRHYGVLQVRDEITVQLDPGLLDGPNDIRIKTPYGPNAPVGYTMSVR